MSLQRIILAFVLAGLLFSWNLAAEEVTHIVARNETIWSISRFYSVNPNELMRVNNISDPSKLQIGRRLVIPSAASGASGQTSSSNTQALADYRVVRGDTLFSIARNNGITLQNLLDINRFSSDHVLKAGDIVKIPAPAPVVSAVSQPPAGGLLSLRWPVNARSVVYMTGQMGVVVEGEANESVRSLTGGRVVSAGPWRKYGKVAIVEAAGGYLYMYGGCETLSVNVGDRISVGAEVGRLGVNAVSEKAQLFFMVFRNDVPIDPARAPRAGGNTNI